MDEFLVYITGLFVKSHIADFWDSINDLQLLFDEAYSSSVVMRIHSDPPIHSLHA